MFGCQRKEFEVAQYTESQKRNVIYAALEDVQTRTSLGEDNKPVWSEGDELISFMNNSYGSRYCVSAESAGHTLGSFILKEEAVKGSPMDVDILYYPYDSDLTCQEADRNSYKLMNVTFPSLQIYQEGSFAEGAMPMVAVAKSGAETFSFMNLGGILKLQITGNSVIRSIILSGNAGEKISGQASVVLNEAGGVPVVKMSDSNVSETVELDCGINGVQLDPSEPVEFMIALPPVSFNQGFSIKVIDMDGGMMEKVAVTANEVGRSGILKMPSFGYEVETYIPTAVIDALSVSYDDVKIKVDVKNAVQFCGGFKPKESFQLSEVVRDVNWKKVPRMTDSFLYEGSLSCFPAGDFTQLSSGKTYVVWVAPYGEGQTIVKAEDVVYREFTLPEALPGGSVNVYGADLVVEHHSITVTLAAPGASVIYAHLLTDSEVAPLEDTDALIDYLFNNACPVKGEECSVTRSSLETGERLHLIACAVDSEGRYGNLLEQEYATRTVEYNENLTLALSVSYEGRKAMIRPTYEGGEVVRYYWFCDKTNSSAWKKYFGASLETAEKYMTTNFDSYYLHETDVASLPGGCIELDNMYVEEEYVIVIMAEDASGKYSHVEMLKFVNHLDLGSFVYRSGEMLTLWRASKPEITFGDCGTDGEFYTVQWYVKPVAGTIAYSACIHPDVIASCPTAKDSAILVYNLGKEVIPSEKNVILYGDEANLVYVTWQDSDGNFYEPFGVKVP